MVDQQKKLQKVFTHAVILDLCHYVRLFDED